MRVFVIFACVIVSGCAMQTSNPTVTSAPVPKFLGLAPEIWGGTTDQHGVVAFKGLPFAAAPVGERRWQPPQPYEPKAGERLADDFAAACMQGPHTVNWYQDLIRSLAKDPALFPEPEQGYSEDCLYLNVWTPNFGNSGNDKATNGLPVMVWIHGGSNKGGWSFEPDYRGAGLARRDVVVVSVAYRVGVFGYFSHPQLLEEQGIASNYGLLDLIAALNWVGDHIEAFGGDPQNVTLFGESAGAANIGHLMSSPQAAGLFQRAVHQSGGYQQHHTPSLSDQTDVGSKLATTLNTNLAGLRNTTAATLLAVGDEHFASLGYSSAVGGHGLPRSPASAFAAGEVAQVPLLIGTNANEWLMYLEADQTVDGTVTELGLQTHAGQVAQQLKDVRSEVKMDRLSTANNMRCPSYEMASAVSQQGVGAWVYHFSRVREGAHWQSVGAYHGAEIPYIFNSHADWLETQAADHKLTDTMQRYWVNFASTGDPNGGGLPRWQSWNTGQHALELNASVAGIAAPDLWLCDLLQQ